MLIWILIAIALAFAAYVRFAPNVPERWHRPAHVSNMGETKMKGGYVWRVAVDGDAAAQLEALDDVAMASPRTTRLAGSPQEGRTTYVTRSAVFGFPDFTTIGVYEGQDGDQYLEMYGRLRFGRSDLGVNTRRLREWRAAVE